MATSVFGVLAGLGLLLAQPVEAQHSGGRGSSGHGGSHSSGSARTGAGSSRGGVRFAGSGAARWSARPSPPVVMTRPQVVMTRPVIVVRPMMPRQRWGLRSSTGPAVPVRRPLIGVVPPSPPPFFGFDPFHRFHHFRHFHHGFGFPFCSSFFGVSFATRHFGFFGREFACFEGPFVSPFFFPFVPTTNIVIVPFPVAPTQAATAAARTESEGMIDEASAFEAGIVLPTEQPAEAKPAPPLTLLELKDGSMYGLTDYWLENGQLHYRTSYGGENAVPLERVDLDKTVQLNWERGVPFVLRPKPASH